MCLSWSWVRRGEQEESCWGVWSGRLQPPTSAMIKLSCSLAELSAEKNQIRAWPAAVCKRNQQIKSTTPTKYPSLFPSHKQHKTNPTVTPPSTREERRRLMTKISNAHNPTWKVLQAHTNVTNNPTRHITSIHQCKATHVLTHQKTISIPVLGT